VSVIICATGFYIPEGRKNVSEIAQRQNVNLESLASTGHRLVSVAISEDTPAWMAIKAARIALDNAEFSGSEVDVIIYCGSHKDYGKWQAATMIQEHIGNRHANSFDLYQGCNTPLLAVSLAQSLIKNDLAKRVLIVASERWDGCTTDHMLTQSIFVGDGAAALIVCREDLAVSSHPKLKPIAFSFRSNGEFNDLWYIRNGGTNAYLQAQQADDHLYRVRRLLNKEELNRFQNLASRYSQELLASCLKMSGLNWDDINFIIMMNGNARHNLHYLNSINGQHKPNSNCYIGDVGHLGGADFILNINQMMIRNELQKNEYCLAYSGGSGYSWSTAIFHRTY
jgi:3-oxoacyl-[acyl-carrier-protein] synthase III